jgi:hypothetical protein
LGVFGYDEYGPFLRIRDVNVTRFLVIGTAVILVLILDCFEAALILVLITLRPFSKGWPQHYTVLVQVHPAKKKKAPILPLIIRPQPVLPTISRVNPPQTLLIAC